MRIILLSCVSKKKNEKSKAEELYLSPLFKKSINYARSLYPDKIFILSAKYGLLELDKEIGPYDETLNKMSKKERETWSKGVLEDLKKKTNLAQDEFIFLAGKNYREFLLPHIKNFDIPMKGLGIGRQLKWLSECI